MCNGQKRGEDKADALRDQKRSVKAEHYLSKVMRASDFFKFFMGHQTIKM